MTYEWQDDQALRDEWSYQSDQEAQRYLADMDWRDLADEVKAVFSKAEVAEWLWLHGGDDFRAEMHRRMDPPESPWRAE